jgi:hypothetical protein
MTQLSHEQYDVVERALSRGTRIAVFRLGREYVVIPISLGTRDGREAIETRNPVTGHQLTLYLDEIEGVEAVG